jgi:formate hydrogenlyase transcriptional activator
VDRGADELCSFMVTELRGIAKYDVIGITKYDEPTAQLTWLRLENKNLSVVPTPCAWEGTVSQWVYEHQQPIVISSLDQDTRFSISKERLKSQGLQSICMLPLTAPQRKIGTIYFGNDHVDTYSEEEIRFLSMVAGTVGVAVGNALSFEESRSCQLDLRGEKDRLRQLLDLTNCLVSNRDLSDMLRVVAASLRETLRCDIGQVMLPEPGSNRLRVSAVDSVGRTGAETQMQLTGSICEHVFRTGETRSGNVRDLELFELHHLLDHEDGSLKTICVFPLVRRNRPLGVLALGRFQERPFTQDDLALLGQLARQVAIAVDNALAYHHIADVRDKLVQQKLYLEDEIQQEMPSREIIGESDALRSVLQEAATVAATGSTVLIYGETGTGKELIARMVHDRSQRTGHAFVKINCAAIPLGLLESELFGHEKGAFTGAVAQRIGRFELANNGTLFLDEIGETPLELQPKLLHVLQEQEFERLGGNRTIHTDVRLIAATNRDLAELVERKAFRSDLFYCLNVFPIRVPPLRDRTGDIPLLAWHFVRRFANRMKRTINTIPAETMDCLRHYH